MLIDKNTEHQIEQTHVNYVKLCLPTKTKREDTPSTSKTKQKKKKNRAYGPYFSFSEIEISAILFYINWGELYLIEKFSPDCPLSTVKYFHQPKD